MPLNLEARTLLDYMASVGAPPLDSQDPVTARAERAALTPEPIEDCHEIVDLDADGVPVRLYSPNPPDSDGNSNSTSGLLVYIHGGGWVLSSVDGHDNVCRALANRSGHKVLSVEYRLAPEHPFPAPLDDCLTATAWAHRNATALGVDATRIAIGGDSAGANLATVVCNESPVPLVFQLLVYPVTDCRMNTQSFIDNGEGYFLTASSMRWFIDHYLTDGGSIDDPRVSPLLADDATLARQPPAMVITAGFDPLRDEGVAYADRLADAGVRVTHVEFAGQFHGFFSLAHVLGDAKLAHAAAAESLATALAQRAD